MSQQRAKWSLTLSLTLFRGDWGATPYRLADHAARRVPTATLTFPLS